MEDMNLPMPIRVKPYLHQQQAFNFACKKFGVIMEGGDSFEHDKSEMFALWEGISKEKNRTK